MGGGRLSSSEHGTGNSCDPRGMAMGCKQSGLVAYSLSSGFVATVAGAAVSLLFKGNSRLIVWCTVAAASSVMYGLAYSTLPVIRCRVLLHRWIRASPGA